MTFAKESFDFYDCTIEVSSPSVALVEEIRRDFSYFCKPAEKKLVRIHLSLSPPDYKELPSVPASLITPRNVCFRNGDVSYIDYFGNGLAVYDRKEQQCTIYGTDFDLVHEIAYLFMLSTVGEYFDSRGIHRIHALGVSYHQQGILLLLPSGGGKSTMALRLLCQPDFLLLSEDTPLIDRRGYMRPFPLRLGVRPEQNTEIPSQYLRTMRRMEFDPKTLIDLEYFRDRIGQAVRPAWVLVGQRNLGEVAEIIPLTRHRALQALVKDMVVGLGIYQGIEFLLERGIWELLGKGGVISSRFYNSLRLLSNVSTYRFILGRNTEKNCQTLLEFLAKAGMSRDHTSDH